MAILSKLSTAILSLFLITNSQAAYDIQIGGNAYSVQVIDVSGHQLTDVESNLDDFGRPLPTQPNVQCSSLSLESSVECHQLTNEPELYQSLPHVLFGNYLPSRFAQPQFSSAIPDSQISNSNLIEPSNLDPNTNTNTNSNSNSNKPLQTSTKTKPKPKSESQTQSESDNNNNETESQIIPNMKPLSLIELSAHHLKQSIDESTSSILERPILYQKKLEINKKNRLKHSNSNSIGINGNNFRKSLAKHEHLKNSKHRKKNINDNLQTYKTNDGEQVIMEFELFTLDSNGKLTKKDETNSNLPNTQSNQNDQIRKQNGGGTGTGTGSDTANVDEMMQNAIQQVLTTLSNNGMKFEEGEKIEIFNQQGGDYDDETMQQLQEQLIELLNKDKEQYGEYVDYNVDVEVEIYDQNKQNNENIDDESVNDDDQD